MLLVYFDALRKDFLQEFVEPGRPLRGDGLVSFVVAGRGGDDILRLAVNQAML